MVYIDNVYADEVMDSRGNPTVEVELTLENDIITRSIVPSGASTGVNEALELRDNDLNRYQGKGVLKAVNNVNTIIKNHLIGKEFSNQKELDLELIKLDGTPNKSNLGANAILGVSMSYLKAMAKLNNKKVYEYIGEGRTLPVAMMNILNGGAHADNNLDFQEFMIVPNRDTMKERIRVGSEVFHTLKKVLNEKGYSTGVGDEGGFAPNLNSNKEGFDLIVEAITKAGYIPGKDVNIAIDVAASQFYKDGYYQVDNKKLTIEELISYLEDLVNIYPIISIEDPTDENDFSGFSLITKKIGDKIQLVGDDIFVTNIKYLQKGINMKAGNSILIKINQIGTITETIETINLAKSKNYKTVISHRSGETEDTTIADLAVGLNLGQIKTGSMSRTDRICKYNQLMRIEDEINCKNI